MYHLSNTTRKNHLQILLTSAIVVLLSTFSAISAHAATLTLSLERTSTLTSINDAEGRSQLDGGKVFMGESLVGYYTRKKRVSFAFPASINKATVEITVIWTGGNYTFTLQGTQSATDGSQVGSVSAASAGFTAMHDSIFSGTGDEFTIYY